MTTKTVVINHSGTRLKLKEGNAGVYRELTTLKEKSGMYVIRCNTYATSREYWVGTGVEDGDETILSITSDDCVQYQTVYIIDDPDDHAKIKLKMVNRGVKETAVVNQTGADVKLTKKGGAAEPQVLKNGETYVIKNGPKEAKCCSYSVEAGGLTIPISTEDVAKAQRINIPRPANGQAKLDMLSRRLYLTEVTNKASAAITVRHCKGEGGSNTDVLEKRLQPAGKEMIEYDPKKGRKYWVEYSSTATGTAPSDHKLLIASEDFANFGIIDIVTHSSAGTEPKLGLEKLEPRPSVDTGKKSLGSRILGFLGF